VIEGVFQAKDMVLIIDIHLLIQLVKTKNKHMLFGGQSIASYLFEDLYLHAALRPKSWPILDHLDRKQFARRQMFTLDYLTKSPLSKQIYDTITIASNHSETLATDSMICLCVVFLPVVFVFAKDIIHVQDIVMIFIVVAVVLCRFRRLGQDAFGIPVLVISKLGIPSFKGFDKMDGGGE
jgi:hypothetical protein